MRFHEFTTTEARSWTSRDDRDLVNSQIAQADNTHAFYVYAPFVHITNAVRVLAMQPEAKWFFDFLTTKLHKLETEGVSGLYIYLSKFDDEWHTWAVDDEGNHYDYPSKSGVTFPLELLVLRAVNEAGFWHVLVDD
jgi:hypothetical protein